MALLLAGIDGIALPLMVQCQSDSCLYVVWFFVVIVIIDFWKGKALGYRGQETNIAVATGICVMIQSTNDPFQTFRDFVA